MPGLIDSTLREGSQMVGVAFSLEQKLAIVAQLDRLGIEEIEAGVASALDRELPALMAGCREMGLRARIALWCRCREEDIRFAAQLKPDVLALSIPSSDLHITKKLGKNRTWTRETVFRSIKLARELGIGVVSLGLEDATRAEQSFLLELVATAAAAGVNRVRLADTVGVASPAELAGLVMALKENFALEVGVHCHNDFGMATANSLAALEAGADWADVTVLGLGERAGNARLEEVAGFLAIRRGRAYCVSRLRELAALVSRLTDQTITPHQPLLGERIFHCESGLHLQGLNIDPSTYEPYGPELVGAERHKLYGGKIGRGQLQSHLAAAGYNPSATTLGEMLGKIRATLSGRKPLEEAEFGRLLRRCIG